MKIRVYTDGACRGNPGPGGWGGIILLKDKRKEISGYEAHTTNNRMELSAVVKCLELLKKYKKPYKGIEVYSDSAYVVNAVKNGWLKRWKFNGWLTRQGEPVKNKDLWILLDAIMSECKVTMVKIKGHSGHKHNERVDIIAKEAIDTHLQALQDSI